MNSTRAVATARNTLTVLAAFYVGACFPSPKDADMDADTAAAPEDTSPTTDGTTQPDTTMPGGDTTSDDVPDTTHNDVSRLDTAGDADDTTEPDTTVIPRCPGGSLQFSWGTESGKQITITEPLSVSEFIGDVRISKVYSCPDDFFGATSTEPRWDGPIVVSWRQELGTSPSWDSFATAFNAAPTLADYLTQAGQAAPDLTLLPEGKLTVTSSTDGSREFPLRFIRPRAIESDTSASSPSELIAFEAGESPNHGFQLDIDGVGQDIRVDTIALRLGSANNYSPEIRYPFAWNNAYYANTSGQLRIHNPCGSPGERAFFGRRDVWTWYAPRNGEKKDMSLRFLGPDGLENKRYNLFGVQPTSYQPEYDACNSGAPQEVIVLDFDLMEGG